MTSNQRAKAKMRVLSPLERRGAKVKPAQTQRQVTLATLRMRASHEAEAEWQKTPRTATMEKFRQYRATLPCPKCDATDSLLLKGEAGKRVKAAICTDCNQRTTGKRLSEAVIEHENAAKGVPRAASAPPQIASDTEDESVSSLLKIMMRRMDTQGKLIHELQDSFRAVLATMTGCNHTNGEPTQTRERSIRPVGRQL